MINPTSKDIGKRHDWVKDAPELAGVVGKEKQCMHSKLCNQS